MNHRVRRCTTIKPDDRLLKPLYSIPEAASYVGVPTSTFRRWVRGYERRSPGRRTVRGEPLLTSVPGSGLTIPFIGLAEGMVLTAFRETGLPLQRIRPALRRLADEGHLEHALASKSLFTDGAEILFDYATEHHDRQLRLLTVVRSGQRVFHEVIDHYLQRIDYEHGWASRIVLPTTEEHTLIADPDVAFGRPRFIRGGAPLDAVLHRVAAGEPERSVARDYGITIKDLRAAREAQDRAIPSAA